MKKLAQLETPAVNQRLTTLPPLSQSRQAAMACPALYTHLHIFGKDQQASEYALRGREVHEVISTYVKHLVEARRTTDVEFFDALAAECSPDAAEALVNFREGYVFDPQKVYATELYIALDEHFFAADETDRPKVYEGTLDMVQLLSPAEAVIDDWKSYFQVVEADTFQAKLYPLLMFCLNPSLEKITFRLQFVRWGAVREVTYTRADAPKLRTLAERERKRQAELHELVLAGEEPAARPGRHCTWCPKLLTDCPLRETNPHAVRTPQESLEYAMFLQRALKGETQVLKDWVNEHGPVGTADANGNVYQAAFVRQERASVPLVEGLVVLDQWEQEQRESFRASLSISGVKPFLKAKKRKALQERMGEVMRRKVGTKFQIGEADDADEGDGDAR